MIVLKPARAMLMVSMFAGFFFSHVILAETDLASNLLPTEYFSRLPNYRTPRLSPDGRKIAVIHNVQEKGIAVLITRDMKAKEQKHLLASDNEKVRVNWFQWVNNDTLVVSVLFGGTRFGVETMETRLIAVDVSGQEKVLRPLIKPRRVAANQKHYSQFQDQVIDILPNDHDHILMAIDLDKQNEPSVYRLDVYSKKMKRVERPTRKIRNWITDQQGRIRAGQRINYKTGQAGVLVREPEKKNWIVLFTFNALEEPVIEAVGFDLDPNVFYYKRYNNDKKALYKVNLVDMKHELVFSDPNYDVDGALIYSPRDRHVIGIDHVDGKIYWDEKYQAFQDALDKALPDKHNSIVSTSNDEVSYILHTQNDYTAGSYYLGNRVDKNLIPLFSQYPELPVDQFTPHQLVSYTARDGTDIEGYLTVPSDRKGPIATILFPHGGPGLRETGGFDYWTSFFSSRGYAVFRPNFRGSSGYGYEFAASQMGAWGLSMQDDLTDATRWLIEQGVADPDRICIVGGSYGGYAALMGLARTPDLFKCGVSFAGVSSLRELVIRGRDFLNSKFVNQQIGTNRKDLEARSPLNLADRISSPLLLVHGKKDRIVDVEQSRLMAKALEKEGKEFSYVEFETGNHHLAIQRHRHEFFRLLEDFLAEHLAKNNPALDAQGLNLSSLVTVQ